MKKRLFTVLIVTLMCASVFAASVQSGTLSGESASAGSGNSTINTEGTIAPMSSNPQLDISWTMNAAQEVYEVGFTGDRSVDSNPVNVANKLTLATVQTTSDYHGEGKVNVYWKIRTTHPFAIKIAGNGPLLTNDGTQSDIDGLPENAREDGKKINWTASWTPKTVSAMGTTEDAASGAITLGDATTVIPSGNTDYTTPKPVFTMDLAGATAEHSSMIKNGVVEVSIVTQNVLNEDKNPTKVTGNYTGYLTLTVATK